MKNVFITGAAGFIGGYIVNQFVEEGWHVLALVHRTMSPALNDLSEKGLVTIIRGDLRDVPAIEAALKKRMSKLDVIVHCAGRASDVGWRRTFRRTNYDSVRELVGVSKRMNIERFVFISTTDVYGLNDFHGEAEDELPLRARPKNFYPIFKIAAENFIRRELSPDQFVIIRPAQVWGIGDQTLTPRIVAFLRGSSRIVHFGRWRGQNRWPLAHVCNVALSTFLAAVDSSVGGQAINVVDDEQTTVDEFCRILAELYLPNKKLKTIMLPFWLGQCVAVVISGISTLLNLNKPFTDPSFYALYAVSHNLDFSNHRMKQLFARTHRRCVTRVEGLKALAEANP